MRCMGCAKYGSARILKLLPVLLGLLLFAFAPGAKAQDESALYLPAIQGPPPPVLYGTVTYAGQPIGGMAIDLWRYSSADPVLVATTVTGSDGIYRFVDVPRPESEEVYTARFDNYRAGSAWDDRFAGGCETNFENGEGNPTRLGDFAIDNIWEETPKHDSTQKLPVTFTWTHDVPEGGVYNVIMYTVDGYIHKQFMSPDVTGAKTYTLTSLPEGFSYDKTYGWSVLHFTDQAVCNSFYTSYVTFKK